MQIQHGKGTSVYGPGVDILLTGEEVVQAIHVYLMAHGVHINGARTVMVNEALCGSGRIYVDPQGNVMDNGTRIKGEGGIDL